LDKLDILNRKEFVENLISLTERLSDNKKNVAFAIDGEWGVGKSFVLDMYAKELSNIQSEKAAKDKYFIVSYNCWKYDYYEEPLIAIVSTIIETIEQKTQLFPNNEKKSKILGVLKAVGLSLLSMANSSIQQKTGVDFKKAYDVVKKGVDLGAKAYEQKHDYDVYFGFNKTITALQETLKDIAEEYTIIFLVDELDRCLPEYTIKVLERIHHLTDEFKNIITVLAIDKSQLVTTIKTLFGFEDPEIYLKKFIGFELKLDKGKVSEKFIDKYAEYVALFDKELLELEDSIEEFIQVVFKNIDARTQRRIVERAFLVHKLLYNDKKDYSFMCLELLMVIVNTCYNDAKVITHWLKDYVGLVESHRTSIAFDSVFKEKLEQVPISKTAYVSTHKNDDIVFENEKSLYSIVICCWKEMFLKSYSRVNFVLKDKNKQEFCSKQIEELKKYAETLKIIK
jgi:hypothetical protein